MNPKLLDGKLSLRNYNAHAGEIYAMVKVLNKLTGLSMPEVPINMGQACILTYLSNKAPLTMTEIMALLIFKLI